MNEIKSLADQLRQSIAKTPGGQSVASKTGKAMVPKSVAGNLPLVLREIMDYDSSRNKAMVHAKLDEETARFLARFKMATGVDNIKLVAFAVRHLFATQPELKTYVKNFIQNVEL